ncbi:MAG: peptidyl-prolyl cis-trans isomerase, partial [Deltaproteobacteria bacterium]
MNPSRTGLFLASMAFVSACETRRPAADSGIHPIEGLLVTVNGHPLTRADVQASIRTAASHGGTAETEQDALERIIQEELVAQQALAMNLDADPAFREQDRLAEARFHATRRAQLAALFEQHQTAQRPAVSDAEAHAYYDANGARIRTEVRIQQILVRDEATAQQAAHDIQGGAAFEEVARRQFPNIDATLHPWELGTLRWNVIPDPWRATLDTLTVGQTSDVISGPNHR